MYDVSDGYFDATNEIISLVVIVCLSIDGVWFQSPNVIPIPLVNQSNCTFLLRQFNAIIKGACHVKKTYVYGLTLIF